ncbi:MAG: hypothetical protein ABI443_11140 [Chthoniobacterales bacterium]
MRPPFRILLVFILALCGGWAAASCFMVIAFTLALHPKNNQAILEILKAANNHFIFVPPLFGTSPYLYALAAFSIFIICIICAWVLPRSVPRS